MCYCSLVNIALLLRFLHFLCNYNNICCTAQLVSASQCVLFPVAFFFFKQKTAYEMRISDWSSDVCSSDLALSPLGPTAAPVIANVVVALFGLAAIGLWLWGLGVDAEDWGRLIGRVWHRTGPEIPDGEDVEDQPAPRRVDAPRPVSAATAAAPTKKIVERAAAPAAAGRRAQRERQDRKSTRLNSSH